MLKNKGKAFVPKKFGPRKPGGPAAPTSTRPIATPAPSQQSETDPIASIETNKAAVTENAILPTPQSSADNQDRLQEGGAVDESSTSTSEVNQLKRKERNSDVPHPSPKRTAIEIEPPHNTSQPDPQQDSQITPIVEASRTLPSTAESPPQQTQPQVENVTLPPATPASSVVERRPLPNSLPPAAVSNSGPASDYTNPLPTPQPTAPVPDTTKTQNSIEAERSAPTEVENGRRYSRSPPPSADEAPPEPQHRYPSPENMVRLADDMPAGEAVGVATMYDQSNPFQASQVVEMASLNPDGTSGGVIDESATTNGKGTKAKGKTVARGRKIQATAVDGEDDRPTVGMQLSRPRRPPVKKIPKPPKEPKQPKQPKQPKPVVPPKPKKAPVERVVREETPEDPEEEKIDRKNTRIADLCKDLKIGKTSSRHEGIMQRLIEKKKEAAAAKFRRDHPDLVPEVPETPTEDPASEPAATGTPAADDERESSPEAPQAFVTGPQMRIVGGQIVLDETSTVIDRQAIARQNQVLMEEVVEDEFSRLVNQGNYMKQERTQRWDEAAMNTFYKGLRMFGTDFQMIAGMFPHRSRRQIKLKFNKEERENPTMINNALLGIKEDIDLDHFEKMGEKKLEEKAAIDAEQQRIDEEQRAEVEKFLEAQAEAVRKKKASIKGSEAARRMLEEMGSDDEAENHDPNGGSRTKGKGKGKGRAAAAKRKKQLEADNYEVVGTIE